MEQTQVLDIVSAVSQKPEPEDSCMLGADGAEHGLDLLTYTQWLQEIENQPAWRAKADKEMDYYAGNQLDSGVLNRQREVGIPPAIEPLIGPTIDAVVGMEAKTRLDWRVLAENGGDDIQDALGYELSQAERKSKADQACSDAYASQIGVGLGWVEVSRSQDPFKYRYRCRAIHRNEIWWDWLAKEPDLSDARYLVRRKWMDRRQAKLMFPEQADLIEHAGSAWHNVDLSMFTLDGGQSTGLAMSLDAERGWSIEEMEWRDLFNRRVCLFEVWYRVWERALVLKTPDGRVVEFDRDNEAHLVAIATSRAEVQQAVVSRVRLSWWLGPHKLHNGPSPYRHGKFPYVPFWGKREDRTGVPFGLIRGMMYLQDEVNARVSKMQWGLSAVMTVRTDGAVKMSDAEFNAEISRPDADIILDAKHMAQPGATFRVDKNFQLNQQQANRLEDCREGIKRVGGVYNAFMGQEGQAKSGVAISSLVEQSTQTLADINDNFKTGRAEVGDLLLSLIIEDSIGIEKEILVPATVSKEERSVRFNVPTVEDGIEFLSNDIERMKLRVELADVPNTPTYRAQQLMALSNAFNSMPPHLQSVALPHFLSLMDVPNKQEIIDAIKQASEQPTPEQIKQMIDEAVKDALTKAQIDLKQRDLDIKEKVASRQAEKVGVETVYSAMQAGAVIAGNPAVAPLGDGVLEMAAAETPLSAEVGATKGMQAGLRTPEFEQLGGQA